MEPIAIAALSFSALCHLLSACVVFFPAARVVLRFPMQFVVFVAASFVLSAAGFAARRFRGFLLTLAFRLVALLVASRMASAVSLGAALLLIPPFVLDGCLYAGAGYGAALGIILLGGIVGLRVHDLSSYGLYAGSIDTAAIAVVGFGFTAAAALLVRFRERAAEQEQWNAELSDAVASLSDANKAMQSYAGSVETQSAEKERNRVTRELHDSIGYAFTNIVMTMNAVKTQVRSDPDEAAAALEGVRALAESALADTRRILYRLRSIRDADPGGLKALARLAKSFQDATGVRVTVNYGNLPMSYGTEIDGAIYRLVQEGLTNAFRHGRASAVRVVMWETDREILVNVSDNGHGTAQKAEGIGLSGMRERFEILHGRIETKATADGFELRTAIPYRRLRSDG